MRREGVTSVAAVVLGFLASQHHNLHMLLLALGLGGGGFAIFATSPLFRRTVVLVSLGVVAWNVASLGRGSGRMRALVIGSSALTLAFIGWSVIQFGL